METIVILIPYFGKWPYWINIFIESCKFNPTIDWLFFTDCQIPSNQCDNVAFIEITWEECRRLISEKLNITFNSEKPYKLCDIRPAFGQVFSNYIINYDFFGFGDIDVIYGNIRKFLTTDVMKNDCITFNNKRINGHLCLFRNNEYIKTSYLRIPNWQYRMEQHNSQWLDEDNMFYGIEKVYARESFNTPFSSYVPWMDGEFNFPSEWYWINGTLTNSVETDYEFLYLHFMRIKLLWPDTHLNNVFLETKNTKYGWKIDLNGISAILEDINFKTKLRAGFD